MRRSAWKAIAAAGAVLGGAGIVALITHRKDESPLLSKKTALIGDSYAVGLGPELAKLLPNFKYEGHVGTNTSQWAYNDKACGECGEWITTFKPDVALVSLGVNDGHFNLTSPLPGVPVRPYTGNYQRIVSALHGVGAKVIWIEPPANVRTTATDVPTVRSIIALLGVPTVPATRTPIGSDGLHPKSYSGWAQEVAQVVSNA